MPVSSYTLLDLRFAFEYLGGWLEPDDYSFGAKKQIDIADLIRATNH